MKLLKQIFDFYLISSIHVALSCYALVRITFHIFHIQYDESMALFVFFGTIVGYNFVKYDALVRVKKSGRKSVENYCCFEFCFGDFSWVLFFSSKANHTNCLFWNICDNGIVYTSVFSKQKKCPKLGWCKNLYCSTLLGRSYFGFAFNQC